MDSDSDVDLSWVELAAEAGARPPKRAITPSAERGGNEAKRQRLWSDQGPNRSGESSANNADAEMESASNVMENPIASVEMSMVATLRQETGSLLRELERVLNNMVVEDSVGQEKTQSFEIGRGDVLARSVTKGRKTSRNETQQTGLKSSPAREKGGCICSMCWNPDVTALIASGRQSRLTTPETGRLCWRFDDGRPFAEPPDFNYTRFERECIPTDKKINEMFPGSRPRATAYRDTQTEHELLTMFKDWAETTQDPVYYSLVGKAPEGSRPVNPHAFHADLAKELSTDLFQLKEELRDVKTEWIDLQRWQHTYLDADGGLTYARKELDAGKNIFFGQCGVEALKAYENRLAPIPRDDLASWEELHLDADGKGTQKLKEKLRAGIDPFDTGYFGGTAAKDKYDHFVQEVIWEIDYCVYGSAAVQKKYKDFLLENPSDATRNGPFNGETKYAEKRLRVGVDIFRGQSGQAAFGTYGYLLGKLPRQPRDDLETWEWFHTEKEEGGSVKMKQLSSDGYDPFEPQFYGATAAKEKHSNLMHLFNWESHYMILKGDLVSPKRRLREGEDVFRGECGKAALEKYGHILQILSRPPKHDIETWEWFHLDDNGGTTRIQRQLPRTFIYDGWKVLTAKYYGGVEARSKYAHLVSEDVRRWIEENKSEDGAEDKSENESANEAKDGSKDGSEDGSQNGSEENSENGSEDDD